MRKPTLVVIADAGRVKLFSTDDRGATVKAVPGGIDAMPNPPSREHKSDKPGRGQEGSGRRTSFEPKHDPHKQAEDEFSRLLAKHLEGLTGDGTYADIVLFAPPVFLGELRQHMSRAVADKIAAEVHKDLTKSTTENIQSHVREALFPG